MPEAAMGDDPRDRGTAVDTPVSPWKSLTPGDVVDVLDRLSDGIAVFDPDWRVRYLNEPAAMMLGRSHQQLLGKRIWNEFPNEEARPFRIVFEEAMASGKPQRLIETYAPLATSFESRIFPQPDKLVVLFRDVTEELASEDELRESVERMEEAEQIVGFGVWKWEMASSRVSWSDELHRIYGLRPGEFEGTVDAFVARVHPDDRERVWGHISRSLETRDPFAFEERVIRGDGGERTLLSQGRVLIGSDGAPSALVGVCHDITEQARVEEALGTSERRMHAIIDNTPSMITVKDLDGVYVMANAETERIVGVAPDQLIGLHCTDVFPAGLAAEQRASDRLAAGEGEPVYGEARLLREGEQRDYVTVTFPLPDEAGLPAETCTIATDVTERKEREGERRERSEWTAQIRSALAEDRMLAFAQPIVDLRTGDHAANEMLVRMREPGERPQILEPAAFLPAAERHGLVQSIDAWMVAEALRRPEQPRRQVNVSAVTMSDVAARERILDLLEEPGAGTAGLVFEITETADVVQLEAARQFAVAVTTRGCSLALDDFGVGFGSFTYLRSLPLSYLKIDLSFVRGLTDSGDDRRVVQGIVGIARSFGLETIAEGVEDEETLELLREIGADYAQGYHLGRPQPAG